jgi:transposase
LLKVYGLKIGAVHRCTFAARVETLVADTPDLRTAIEPLLEARNMMRKKKALLDRHLGQVARKDEVCKRLMTVSGVGPIVSLSFKASVDDPNRFKNSKAVAAHFGLTPRVYQSGELDRSGNISKCGDKLMRHALYEAANSHLRISKKWSTLRAWGVKLAKRIGNAEGLRGSGTQARHHHASDVGRRDGFPVRPGARRGRSVRIVPA